MTNRAITDDDRAVSSSVTHVTALGITIILITGLFVGANGMLQNEREKAAREQLRSIGNRMADEMVQVSKLAQSGGNITITSRHQDRVAGERYTIDFLTGDPCETDTFNTSACLQLELSGSSLSVKVPVRNQSSVEFSTEGSGTFTITADGSGRNPQSDTKTNVKPPIGIGEDVTSFGGNTTSVKTANRDPIAGFTFSPGTPTISSVIHFQNDTEDLDGIISKYEWDLGDGTEKTGVKEFNHSYSDPGKYTVTLNVTDDDEESDNVSKIVSVGALEYNEDVQADDVSGTIQEGRLTFNITNEHSESVVIREILIDPKDDSIDWLSTDDDSDGFDGTNEIYIDGDNAAGGHDDELEIFDDGRIFELDDDGNVNSGDIELSAGDKAQVDLAGFGEDVDSNPKTDMTNKEVIVALRYDVDGGNSYTSKFTLFGSGSANDPPDPDFTYSCTERDCSFDASSSSDDGSISSYDWDFDDGNTSTGQTPSNTFPAYGDYDVSLTVVDDDGVSSTLTKTVSVAQCSTSDGFTWYNDAWTNRKEITIDGSEVAGSSTLNDFPIVVDISGDSDLANDAQNDGDDILFADGCKQLNHEIEEFDGSNGDLVAWVNVTNLKATSDTEIYMYYNNSGASNQENVEGVWGPDYEMVQHFEESSGTPTDSTSNNNDGTNNGATQGTSGQLNGGYDFDGGSGDVSVPDSINDGEFSIEVWFDSPGWSWDGILFDATKGNKYFHIYADDHDVDWCFEDANDNDVHIDSGSPDLGDFAWHHTVVTGEFGGNGPHELFLDGQNVGSSSMSLVGKPSLATPLVGDETSGYSGGCESKSAFNEEIDEVRILSRQLSDDWVETEYNNQHDPNAFYSVSQEQAVFQEGSDKVVMEAENYMDSVPGNNDDEGPSDGDDMSGITWSQLSDSDASSNTGLEATPNGGNNAQDTENGERLDYFVDFQNTGTHYVWVRMKCPSGSDDSVHVGLNGTPESYGGIGLTSSPSQSCSSDGDWMWASQADDKNVTVDVPSAGYHVVNVWMREDGTQIDKIVVTTQDPATWSPSGTGPAESPTS